MVFFAMLVLGVLVGLITGRATAKWYGVLVAAVVAWFGFLALLIVTGAPQQDALWGIAQIFGGTLCAVFAGIACALAQAERRNN